MMPIAPASETDLKRLVDKWSNGTLPEREWTHAAHVSTCTYLIWHNTLAQSFELMKAGLYRFNQATGTPNTDERGYHDTLTRFWCTLLFYKIHRGHFKSCLEAAAAMSIQYGTNSRAEKAYYSFDVLRNKLARRQWVAPDVRSEVPLEAFHW